MKSYKIIPLARKKLDRRAVTDTMVSETLTCPDQIVEGHGDRRVAQKKYRIKDRDYLLRIVFEEEGEGMVVVTGYLTSQITRYWESGQDEN